MSNSVNDSAIKKLKLLFTVVDRAKGEFYLDVISQFNVNCQLAMGGLGTASSELLELLVEPSGPNSLMPALPQEAMK